MVERSTAAEEKRRVILDAAVRVFARKGFHTSRVGDIAEEAGVAHGLLYHYFSSKDEVLETVFRENWGVLLERINAVEDGDEPASEQLRHVAVILLRTWLHTPDVVRVLVREIARSPEVQDRIGELVKPVETIRSIIERGPALDDAPDRLDRLHELADAVLHLRAARDLAHEHAHDVGRVQPRAEEDHRDVAELLGCRLVAVLDRVDALEEHAPVLAEHGLEDFVLRREVVVEQPVRDTGLFRDVADA